MKNYRREGSVLHIKSYAFAVRITKMFLHFTENDWKLTTIYKRRKESLRAWHQIAATL